MSVQGPFSQKCNYYLSNTLNSCRNNNNGGQMATDVYLSKKATDMCTCPGRQPIFVPVQDGNRCVPVQDGNLYLYLSRMATDV